MTEMAEASRQNSGGDPFWTFVVREAYVQTPRRVAFPPEVAAALECKPEALSRVAVESPAGCRKLLVTQDRHKPPRTIIRHLADPLRKLEARDAQLVDLVVTGPKRVQLRPSQIPDPQPSLTSTGATTQPAPWGSPPTPLLPRWYVENHAKVRLPAGFRAVYPQVQNIEDLQGYWEHYQDPLDKGASWKLRDMAQDLAPSADLKVIEPSFDLDALDRLPLTVRTRNCLRQGRQSISRGTVGELMRLRNFGITSLLDLMCVLEAAGIEADSFELSTVAIVSNDVLLAAPATQDPAATTGCVLQSDDARLLIAATREFRGATTLGDLLRLDLSELTRAARVDETLDEVLLEDDGPTVAELAVGAVDACLEQMPATQRLVVRRRVVADTPMTLEELAGMAGLSRERVRQHARKSKSDLDAAAGAALDVLALVAVERLGTVTTEPEIENEVARLLPQASGQEVVAARQLLRSRFTYTCRDGICLDQAAAEAADALKKAAANIADDEGLIDEDELRVVLGPEWHDLHEDLVRWIGWSRLCGRISMRATARARVKAALLKFGEPATKSELAEESGLNKKQVAGALSNIKSVARADKHRWGLREWIDDVYEGIPAEIIQRIHEDGGSTRLNRLLEELPRMFRVNETSVWAYLNTPAFRLEHGWVSEADRSDIAVGRLDDVIDGRDDNHDPYWSFSVYGRHLEGYSLQGVPPEVAAALGCYFGTKTTVAVRSPHSCQDISVIWRKTSIHGPEIGRLSPALRALGVNEGTEVNLTIHNSSEVTVERKSKPKNPLSRQLPLRQEGVPSPYQQLSSTIGGVTTGALLSARLKISPGQRSESRNVKENDWT